MFHCKCACGLERLITPIALCSECRNHCLIWLNQTEQASNTTVCNWKEDPSNLKTLCFQRESFKDELFVSVFLALTLSLLVFAAFKPYWQRLMMPLGFYVRDF
ncbi:hypothetical protein HMI55_001868 [Coelomomyces lativittatus]|nr:hypothetical protein HMI55_001868 [Coelomomyces lativittatus]